jgi:addiction module RelB/DinJ family antitoxin
MAKIRTNINLDEELKQQAQDLFAEFGMDLSTAVTVFLKQSIREGGLPFIIQKGRAEAPVEMHYTADPSHLMGTFDEIARRMG